MRYVALLPRWVRELYCHSLIYDCDCCGSVPRWLSCVWCMVCVCSWQHKRRRCLRRLVSEVVVCNRTGWRVNTNAEFLKTSICIFHISKRMNVAVNGIRSLFKMLRELNFCENWGSNSDIDENAPTGIRLHLHGQRIFDIIIYTLLFDEYSNLMQFNLFAAVTMAEWLSKWNYLFGYKWHCMECMESMRILWMKFLTFCEIWGCYSDANEDITCLGCSISL